MHFPFSPPALPWRRLLRIALALPLLAAAAVAAPASADTDITVEGLYHTAGAGCHGSDSAQGCLSWKVRIPSAIAPKSATDVTIEADSMPGQWTWTCPSQNGDEVAGTSSFYIDNGGGEPPALIVDSELSSISELYNPLLGEPIGSVKAVSCTPEHLKLTYEINFYTQWDKTSYLDLDLGTTVAAPGADARSYRFTPTVEVSTRNAILRPTVTANKPAASAAHATVSTQDVRVDGAAKDTSRFTMTARNDSTTPLSGFTMKVPQGKDITCQVDLTGVTGRNTVKAALTTGNQSFSSDYVNHRPVIEVETHPTDFLVEAEPTGTYEVEVGYTVTFTNTTDANGSSSDIVLRPGVPAGFSLKSVTGTGTPWWVGPDSYALQDDGSLYLRTGDSLDAHSSTTMTFTSTYQVNAEAVTQETWKALGTCDPKDPSKGLTMQIDVAGSEGGTEAGTQTICTPVTRTGN